MRNEKKNWIRRFFYLLLLISYFILLTSLTACGRRGDPVAVLPHEEKAAVEDLKTGKENIEVPVSAEAEKNKIEEDKVEFAVPDPPAGLDVLYTQKSIILTWDEIVGQGVRFYKIYRSKGDGFILVGENMTPVFTDRDVEQNVRYFYRITAFGVSESLPSKEIGILTEVH